MSEQEEEHQAQVEDQSAGGGLFGDDEEENENNGQHQQQLQQYQDDLLDDDDILGLDDAAGEVPADHERGLLMRFCPHDSSMLYPKVSSITFRLALLCR